MDQSFLSGANVSQNSLEMERRVSRESELHEAKKYRGKVIQRVPIDLGSLGGINNPLYVSFPFDAVEVIAFTDATGANDFTDFVKLAPGSKDNYNVNNFRECRLGEVIEFDQTQLESYVYLDTPIAGANCTLLFYLGARARSSAINAKITGGVQTSEGASRTTSVAIPVSTAATQIIAANTARLSLTVYFDGPVWLGDSNVNSAAGTERGIYFPGGLYSDQNTAALYAAAVAGSVNAYPMSGT